MAHLYELPVTVKRRWVAPDGSPRRFIWRGVTYQVAEALSRWHLMDRWWMRGVESVYSGTGSSNRYYFRLLCQPDHQVFDVYHDIAQHVWVLETAHD